MPKIKYNWKQLKEKFMKSDFDNAREFLLNEKGEVTIRDGQKMKIWTDEKMAIKSAAKREVRDEVERDFKDDIQTLSKNAIAAEIKGIDTLIKKVHGGEITDPKKIMEALDFIRDLTGGGVQLKVDMADETLLDFSRGTVDLLKQIKQKRKKSKNATA